MSKREKRQVYSQLSAKICKMQGSCRGSHVLSHYFTKQISRVSCCFAVEAVTLQNTKGFSHEEVDKITSLTPARENSTNCETCVGNCVRVLFSHETAMKHVRSCFMSSL